MQAVAKNPAFAKKVGVPQSVGKEFTMKKPMKKPMKKADGGTTTVNPRAAKFTQKATAMNTKFTSRIADMNARKATMPTARQAGFAERIADKQTRYTGRVNDMKARATAAAAMPTKQGPAKKMAAGGLAAGHKAADGVAKKGKTDTKMVKMAKGGMKGCK